MERTEIVLIGPVRAGKSTIGMLITLEWVDDLHPAIHLTVFEVFRD